VPNGKPLGAITFPEDWLGMYHGRQLHRKGGDELTLLIKVSLGRVLINALEVD
jgi:hypothetical protein